MKATTICRSRFKRDNPRQPKRHAALACRPGQVSVTYALAMLLLLIMGAAAVHAQSGGASTLLSTGASTLLNTGASTLLSTGYDLTWNTVDNGGVSFASNGGASPLLSTGYTLGGTAGQPDAATWSDGSASPPLSTGYTLAGGFWSAVSGGETPGGGSKVYLPVIFK